MSGTLRAARRRTLRRTAVSGLAALLATAGVLVPLASGAQAVNSPQGRLVTDQPANGTPHVLDGAVSSIAEVGNTMILGGSFDTARDDSNQTVLTRHRLLAFDATTGQISTSFVPEPQRRRRPRSSPPVTASRSTSAARSPPSAASPARTSPACNVADGAVITAFNAGTVSGNIKDLRLKDGRLWLAGAFTHVTGNAQKGLATVNPTTGAFDHLHAAHHRRRAQRRRHDRPEDRHHPRRVAAGRHRQLQHRRRRQATTRCSCWTSPAPRAAPSPTGRPRSTSPTCSQSFNTYMRDLDISPDGSYFVISTTGAYGGADVGLRHHLPLGDRRHRHRRHPDVGQLHRRRHDVRRRDHRHGRLRRRARPLAEQPLRRRHRRAGRRARDGHRRPRPGQRPAAVSWNPTRDRGVGVFDLLATPRALGRQRHRPDRQLPLPRPHRADAARRTDDPGRRHPRAARTTSTSAAGVGRGHGPERALPRQRRRRRALGRHRHRLGRRQRRLTEPVPQRRQNNRAGYTAVAHGRRHRPGRDAAAICSTPSAGTAVTARSSPGTSRSPPVSRSRCGSTSPTGASCTAQVGQRKFDVDARRAPACWTTTTSSADGRRPHAAR